MKFVESNEVRRGELFAAIDRERERKQDKMRGTIAKDTGKRELLDKRINELANELLPEKVSKDAIISITKQILLTIKQEGILKEGLEYFSDEMLINRIMDIIKKIVGIKRPNIWGELYGRYR